MSAANVSVVTGNAGGCMELKWLEDFLALDAAKNFRIAAEQRYVSQPAFSRRIQALEAWVETPLFDRTSQPSQLTKAGKLFRPIAQQIVDLAHAGKNDIQSQILEDKEKMRFSTLSTLAQIFMPTWLKNLLKLIDANQFIVRTDYNSIADYFDALDNNSDDFFICYEDPKYKFHTDSGRYASLKLDEETLIAVCSPNDEGTPGFWLPDGPKQEIPCLHTLSENSPSPIRHHMANKYRDFTFKSVYESSVSPTLRAMAIEGFGLAWIPSALIEDDLKSGKLVRADEPKNDIIVDINIYRCTEYNEPRVEKFWQILLKQQMV